VSKLDDAASDTEEAGDEGEEGDDGALSPRAVSAIAWVFASTDGISSSSYRWGGGSGATVIAGEGSGDFRHSFRATSRTWAWPIAMFISSLFGSSASFRLTHLHLLVVIQQRHDSSAISSATRMITSLSEKVSSKISKSFLSIIFVFGAVLVSGLPVIWIGETSAESSSPMLAANGAVTDTATAPYDIMASAAGASSPEATISAMKRSVSLLGLLPVLNSSTAITALAWSNAASASIRYDTLTSPNPMGLSWSRRVWCRHPLHTSA
jgi:hypothetical protein